MEPTGGAKERKAKEQLTTVNGGRDERGRLQVPTVGETVGRKTERWRDFLEVPLRSNCRYPFFYIFVHNKSFRKILPNFNLLRTLEVTFFGPLFPRIYGRH